MEDWLIEERMMKALVQALREGNHSLVIGKGFSTEESFDKNVTGRAGFQYLPSSENAQQQEQQEQQEQRFKHTDQKLSILSFDGRGVSDLFRLLHESPEVLEGAQLADKVVGKGAAAMMALGKVKEVYAEVISEPALELLEQEGIRTTYGKLVPHIMNREGTGLCPVETRCLPCKTPAECLVQIKDFLKEMRKIQQ